MLRPDGESCLLLLLHILVDAVPAKILPGKFRASCLASCLFLLFAVSRAALKVGVVDFESLPFSLLEHFQAGLPGLFRG